MSVLNLVTPSGDDNAREHIGARGYQADILQKFTNFARLPTQDEGGHSIITHNATIMISFSLLECIKFLLGRHYDHNYMNSISVEVVSALISLILSVSVSLAVEGKQVCKKIADQHSLWRFSIVSLLFFCSNAMISCARSDFSIEQIEVVIVGYIYMPISAAISVVVFRRAYGQLELCSMIVLMMTMMAFLILRARCAKGHCGNSYILDYNPSVPGTILLLFAIVTSCISSIMAERIFKDRSLGCTQNEYYVHRIHLDLSGLVISLVAWSVLAMRRGRYFGSSSGSFFIYVIICVGQLWLAGLVAKRFSTVVKALLQTMATLITLFFQDLLFDESKTYKALERIVPTAFLVVIMIIAAMIFEQGRANLLRISRLLQTHREGRRSSAALTWSFVAHLTPEQSAEGAHPLNLISFAMKYSVVIFYIMADAARTVLFSITVGGSMITPQSFSLVQNAVMLCLSNVLLFFGPQQDSSGIADLMEAWNIRKLIKFIPCGFFFALTSALNSMAMGLGVSAAMYVVVGKIYLPVCALGSRFLLGKFYMKLEWLAIIIITLDSAAYGSLKSLGYGQSDGRSTPLSALICCAGSATSSALSSLVMEKLLKSEPGKPFMMQKLRTDFSCFLWSFLFLPVMGYISDPGHFAKGAFWRNRPLTQACDTEGACGTWTNDFIPNDGGNTFAYGSWSNGTFVVDTTREGDCSCDYGIFVCWNDIKIYITLALVVFYGFITGLVVKKFGSVMRAVADGFSLLLVYFVGDPLFKGTTLQDMPVNLVALSLPLCSQIFSQAAHELSQITAMITRETERQNSQKTIPEENSVELTPNSSFMTPPALLDFRHSADSEAQGVDSVPRIFQR